MFADFVFEEELEELRAEALRWWERGHAAQQAGRLAEALELYTHSLEIHPTAEAYTFRGWAYSFQGDLDAAIAECHKAIETDPDYGNPYNDIGAYLIQQANYFDAIPWLRRAFDARRYECPFYPRFNLARVYEKLGDEMRAMNLYKEAYELNHNYKQALLAFRRLQTKLN
ncbi:MAG: tetratricopeptide repeat protein [Acidobacteria bacterium]|nr:tetratricopeptide repeat protein [Acidobacteriota bacterium]MBI3424899.1 tetratricopeptide repeat protein [Acidobacteriota bacterium]